jgi:prephenate dehydratase
MRLGFLGPEGTFSHEALLASAGGAGEPVGLATLHDVVVAVQSGEVDRAIAPIENSVEGAINATLDALAFAAPDVVVVGEHVLAVRNCLIARTPLELTAIETVVSHPQPHAQCAAFLRAEVPQATTLAATSTAEAVRIVAGHDGPWAAIGTRLAAERYGAVVLREGIEDEAGNATRFVWLARGDADPFPPAREGSAWKTSVLFHGPGDGTPGWLLRCLSEFASRGVNLTKIESRPLRSRLGHYLFHVDVDGPAAGDDVAGAVAALRDHCEEVRVLGSYPAAPADDPGR